MTRRWPPSPSWWWQLDLLVTIDTSVAHLAGALGVPTFLLLLRTSDWRWFDSGQSSPWYPSLTLFRQRTAGRWDEPLAELAAALAKAGARGQPRRQQDNSDSTGKV